MALKLKLLDSSISHTFIEPIKRINEGQDVSTFLASQAYRDIITFLVQLNRAMFPRSITPALSRPSTSTSPSISQLQALLQALDSLTDATPLDPGSHRFGNTAFRKWHQAFEQQSTDLLAKYLPSTVLEFPHTASSSSHTNAAKEIQAYLLGSFGSAQRLDYGTGHELSFLAFLAGIWKLGGFQDPTNDDIERDIVLNVIEP